MVVWVDEDRDTWLCGTKFESCPQRIKQDISTSNTKKIRLDPHTAQQNITVFVFLTSSSQPLKPPDTAQTFLSPPHA